MWARHMGTGFCKGGPHIWALLCAEDLHPVELGQESTR